MLHLHRIRTDQKIPEIVDAGHYCPCFAFKRSLAPADESLVCLKFHEHVRTIGLPGERNPEYFQIRNFQTGVHIRERFQAGRAGLWKEGAAAQVCFEPVVIFGRG